MSGREWTTEDGYHVRTGWDRPLQRHFLVIDRACQTCLGSGMRMSPEDDECPTCKGTGDDHLFSNLRSPKYPRGDMQLSDVLAEVEHYLTAYPSTLAADLTEDATENRGNFTVGYGTLGRARAEVKA